MNSEQNKKISGKPSVVNMQSLKELTAGDEAFMAEMIEIYLRNTPAMLKEMNMFFEKQDFEKLKRSAHKIKSSLGMMGMSESWQIAEDIELADKKNVVAKELKDKLERLSELVKVSEIELKRELEKPKK